MSIIFQTVLTLIQALLPNLGGNAALVQKILDALIQIVPVLIQEYNHLLPIVKNIIETLQGNDATTEAQLIALQELDAQVDAAFDDAAAKYDAEGNLIAPSS